MIESGYINNGNFREYCYFAGEFCSLKTGIPGGPVSELLLIRHITRLNSSSRHRRRFRVIGDHHPTAKNFSAAKNYVSNKFLGFQSFWYEDRTLCTTQKWLKTSHAQKQRENEKHEDEIDESHKSNHNLNMTCIY